ncbi:PqqD family peptide modification chaperone [Sulfitobacter sp. D35]|uniref:PqqD family peptide modification chaperone n=1 Tax=Sulfitobacter sp. D35 TaxID=3083252 RepID=UPI00296F4185|nr:PqqD family peptide modification chaperone [Sulfitobacter sp. D35]MDW4496654.1 PqqD family peptide modification chaperone [Sulfitobacter sp. D35]
MATQFLSSDWYRVADLRLRLRSHVEIHRQMFRGGIWYVVQDHHNGRFHRISPSGNLILNLMDGRRSVAALWEIACERFPDDPPTQDEVIRLLSQLHRSDLIAGETPPDLDEIARRAESQARRSLVQKIRNPLAMRFPLLDPNTFLDRTVWLARPVFTIWGLLLWLAVVTWGATLLVLHWTEVTGGLVDRVLTVENLFLALLAYPLVKAVHELGHAYATKVWGGEVHEIGVMLLVLIPVPYVDASASSAFASKRRRAVVAGAGIMVELALAALALVFWLNAEPGIARAFAFNVMLVGGISTLFFNGNPLLRFDGYFVLSDLIEIPNLGSRSNAYLGYLAQRYAFGKHEAESPVTARGERGWFVVYAVAAFLYRIFISITISLFVASKFFFIGVMLAIWAVANALVLPLVKGIWFVMTSAKLRRRRARALGVVGTTAAALGVAAFLLPIPYGSVAQGVVWLEEEQVLRAGADGFVSHTQPGAVTAGGDVLALEEPSLSAETDLIAARLDEMRLRLNSVLVLDRVQEDVLRAQVAHLESRLALARAKAEALTVSAPSDGLAVLPLAEDSPGRFLTQGDLVGYLVNERPLKLRVAVPQADADLVLSRTEAVAVRFASDLGTVHAARILRETPGGAARLPSRALAADGGGGPFVVDPADPERLRAFDVAFQFELALRAPHPVSLVGERVYVRFDHGWEPVAPRLWRTVRQLFLARFNV